MRYFINKSVLTFAILVLICQSSGVVAQNERFSEIDRITYEAFQQNDWTKVVDVALKGMGQGIDYYYLRLRTGIALFHLKKYEDAIPHLRKSLEFSEGAPLSLEYLYAAYLYAGRKGEASLLTRLMPEAQKARLAIKAHPVTAFAETGTMFPIDSDTLLSHRPAGALSSHYFMTKYNYSAVGASVGVNEAVSLTLAVQNINFYPRQQYFVANLDPFIFELPYAEKSAYLSMMANLQGGWSLSLASRILGGAFEVKQYQQRPEGVSFIADTTRYRDLALHASLSKRIPYFDLGFSADVNRIRNSWFNQFSPRLTWYPSGNINFYVSGSASWFSSRADSTRSLIMQVKAGLKILPKWWIEAYATDGTVQYWSDNMAYVVYNNLDPMVTRFGLNLLGFGITPNLDLSLRFQGSNRITSWALYSGSEISGYESRKYFFTSLVGGIVWRF